MSEPYYYQPQTIAPKTSVNIPVGPVYNIIVLVAGTSDPINTSADKRSNSYPTPNAKPEGESNWYWEGNKEFRDDLAKLVDASKKYNLALFTAHGWSGDNAIICRQVSGAYLVNRLCGSDGEKPYYSSYLKKEVWFHLIGHSHGGNVINEMTQRMAACKEWPKNWKVKTIVYLSTPFFNKLHPINVKAFHPGAKIVNVFNTYDLTQRCIANFSLQNLTLAATKTPPANKGDKKAESDPLTRIDKALGDLGKFNIDTITKALKSTRAYDADDSWTGVDIRVEMGQTLGAAMYKECIKLFKTLTEILSAAKAAIALLAQPLEFKLAKGLKGKVPAKRPLITQSLANRFAARLDAISSGLAPTLKAFEKRLAANTFPIAGLVDDLCLNKFLRPLVNLLAINAPSAQGALHHPPAPTDSLLDLLHDLLFEQIQEFDDTRATPHHLFKATPFEKSIIPVPVAAADPYKGKRDKAFNKFIHYLERVEARYQKTKSSADLMDMIFTLIAQFEPAREQMDKLDLTIEALTVADYMNFGDDTFDQIIEDLLAIAERYRTILKARDFGSIEVKTDPAGDKDPPKRGSIMYLAQISHSVSRQKLYPKVAEILTLQIKRA